MERRKRGFTQKVFTIGNSKDEEIGGGNRNNSTCNYTTIFIQYAVLGDGLGAGGVIVNPAY